MLPGHQPSNKGLGTTHSFFLQGDHYVQNLVIHNAEVYDSLQFPLEEAVTCIQIKAIKVWP